MACCDGCARAGDRLRARAAMERTIFIRNLPGSSATQARLCLSEERVNSKRAACRLFRVAQGGIWLAFNLRSHFLRKRRSDISTSPEIVLCLVEPLHPADGKLILRPSRLRCGKQYTRYACNDDHPVHTECATFEGSQEGDASTDLDH